ncbi:hypothetical protein B0H66DRAFT_368618 [Apodospora peruviana]|uniref:Uncharacterized protein n=1 Tax=Apodospora peruviana TaxID=516989 RepID=A0AAE0HXS7_9PEZI|nr:hypothetical protein B0H66DRAFT_368618 [Apodospora peruviana]
MAEVLGLVAAIIKVASFGLRLSKTLRDYRAAVVGYEKRLRGLDKDMSFTSGVIAELGSLLEDARVQALVSARSIELARDAVTKCNDDFPFSPKKWRSVWKARVQSVPYESAKIPAELPGLHELGSNAPELDLLAELGYPGFASSSLSGTAQEQGDSEQF